MYLKICLKKILLYFHQLWLKKRNSLILEVFQKVQRFNRLLDFLKIAQKFEIDALDEVCCKCRVHQNNLSNKQRIISVEESILTLKSFLPNKSVEKNLKYHYVSLAIAFLKERKYYSSIITLMRYNLWFLFAIRVYYFSIKFIKIKLLKN